MFFIVFSQFNDNTSIYSAMNRKRKTLIQKCVNKLVTHIVQEMIMKCTTSIVTIAIPQPDLSGVNSVSP